MKKAIPAALNLDKIERDTGVDKKIEGKQSWLQTLFLLHLKKNNFRTIKLFFALLLPAVDSFCFIFFFSTFGNTKERHNLVGEIYLEWEKEKKRQEAQFMNSMNLHNLPKTSICIEVDRFTAVLTQFMFVWLVGISKYIKST